MEPPSPRDNGASARGCGLAGISTFSARLARFPSLVFFLTNDTAVVRPSMQPSENPFVAQTRKAAHVHRKKPAPHSQSRLITTAQQPGTQPAPLVYVPTSQEQ